MRSLWAKRDILGCERNSCPIPGSSLVWFGLVWFGLVWFGLVWFGLVWFGLVSPGTDLKWDIVGLAVFRPQTTAIITSPLCN